MTNALASTVNQAKREQLDRLWQRTLEETLRRGFHGSAAIEISVHDGSIQLIRRRVEQMER